MGSQAPGRMDPGVPGTRKSGLAGFGVGHREGERRGRASLRALGAGALPGEAWPWQITSDSAIPRLRLSFRFLLLRPGKTLFTFAKCSSIPVSRGSLLYSLLLALGIAPRWIFPSSSSASSFYPCLPSSLLLARSLLVQKPTLFFATIHQPRETASSWRNHPPLWFGLASVRPLQKLFPCRFAGRCRSPWRRARNTLA